MVVEFTCAAVLFDLDGVLVDSLGVAERILRQWAADRGIDADRAVALSHGRRDTDLVPLLDPALDVAAEVAWIVEREERTFDGITALPGARRLLDHLDGAPWAVVTSGTRKVALGRIAAAGLPGPRVLVAADDVTRGKPDPQPYLRGAELLGIEPARCLVVEDATAGVRAATAAGIPCLGVGPDIAPATVAAHVSTLDAVELAVDAGAIRISVAAR